MADTELPEPDADPRARWRILPDRIPPEQWITEQADRSVPGSVQEAEAHWQEREAWTEIRWGFG